MAKYKEFFVYHMMVIELGFMPLAAEDEAWKKGAVTLFSFLTFGLEVLNLARLWKFLVALRQAIYFIKCTRGKSLSIDLEFRNMNRKCV
jgi:hypothetical protein